MATMTDDQLQPDVAQAPGESHKKFVESFYVERCF